MFDSISQSELSPLDQIRQAEVEVTRRIAAARETAEQTVARTHSQAERLRSQSREAGQRDGKAQYREIIAKTEEEARVLIVLAHKRAEDLRRRGELHMDIGVSYAIKLILDLEGEASD